jgi:hypothetical protein
MVKVNEIPKFFERVISGNYRDDKLAKNELEEIRRVYERLELPSYQDPEYIGLEYDPIDSEWESFATDPVMRQRQLAALAALDSIVNSGGLMLTDQAVLNKLSSDVGAEDRGRREAILQNYQMRGMGSSGNELAAQMMNAQASANRQAQQSMDVAGMAQKRALDAIISGSDVAGRVRGDDFREAAARAQAMDQMKQFNARNSFDARKYSTDRFNDTIDARNQVRSNSFRDQLSKASGVTGANRDMAGWYTDSASRQAQRDAQIMEYIIKGAKSAASAMGGGAGAAGAGGSSWSPGPTSAGGGGAGQYNSL